MNISVGLKKISRASRFFCALLTLIPLSSSSVPTLHELATEICSSRCSDVSGKQAQLLTQLKQTHDADLSDALLCDSVINALEAGNTFPILTENKDTITQAIQRLRLVPGFYPILRHILVTVDNPDDAKGPLYVLERAILFAPHGTLALGVEKRSGSSQESAYAHGQPSTETNSEQEYTKRRVFDIVTNDAWVKCKNINWKNYPVKAKRLDRVTELRDQFLALKHLVAEHNEKTKAHVLFIVSSKTPIPQEWQTWFDEHHIDYFQATR